MKQIVLGVTTDLTHDQRMQRTCRTLSRAGYKVELVGRRLPRSEALKAEPYQQQRLTLSFHKGKIFYLLYNLRLFWYLVRRPASVVVAVDLDTLPGVWAASRLKRIPCVLDAHEHFTEVPELSNRPATRNTWRLVGHCLVPRLQYAYTVNHSLARLMSKTYQKSFGVVRNVPEHPSGGPPSAPAQSFILYQGALNEGRGLETLIRAAPDLPVPVYLAGDGDLKGELEELVRQSGLSTYVHFLGKLSPDQLKHLTPQAFLGYNLLADTSRSYYYSLANKFFDYMHAGVPNLSNPFPEYARISAAYPVARLIPLEQRAIVETVWALWNDPDRYRVMVEACYRARPVYCWEAEQHRLLEVYREVLGTQG